MEPHLASEVECSAAEGAVGARVGVLVADPHLTLLEGLEEPGVLPRNLELSQVIEEAPVGILGIQTVCEVSQGALLSALEGFESGLTLVQEIGLLISVEF